MGIRNLSLILAAGTVSAMSFASTGFANTVVTANPAATTLVTKVEFLAPASGSTVPKTFKVKMGVTGYSVAPLGNMKTGTGHHHIIVNGGPVKEGTIVPTDAKHIHFGKGQTETEITLPPGKHKLTLQFADGAHRSYGEKMSSTIEVNVQ